jgi:bla regulator protein blaR1
VADKPPTVDADAQVDLQGTTFVEAVQEQLGLKLNPAKAPLTVIVIDHVQRPSEN